MHIEFAARNYRLDDDIRRATEERLGKVAKFLEEPIEVHVVLEVEKHRHLAELRLSHKHGLIQAAEETPAAMREAIQLAIDKVEKQARRARKRFMDRRRRADRTVESDGHWPARVVGRRAVAGAPEVIETDWELQPLTVNAAVLELAGSGRAFMVFRDRPSDRPRVLYRRADGNYGLISLEA